MKAPSITATAVNFDALPDSAQINCTTLRIITGKSRATIYRWVEKGYLPKPRKPAGPTSQNSWTVGEIRHAISGGE